MSHAVCCSMMREDLERRCDQCLDRYSCPDALIAYWPKSQTYGIIVHDGGSGIIEIAYCPWCGADLKSRRVM